MEQLIATADRSSNCFGCSPRNAQGLQLTFVQVGPHTVESRWTPADHLGGAPGILHGGIQAAALDETLGYTAHTWFTHRPDGIELPRQDPEPNIVTAELNLRYRRPVPTMEPLVVRATIERVELPNIHLTGEILDDSAALLTAATARFRVLDSP